MAANKSRKKYQKEYYNYLKLIKYIKTKEDGNKNTKSDNRRV